MKYIPLAIIVVIICCFKTIYKTILKSNKHINVAWVRKYVIKRELIRLVLSMVLMVLNYFECVYEKMFPDKLMFIILSVLSIYVFLRTISRIIIVVSRHNWFEIKTAKCLNVKIEESGSDLDSSSPSADLKTNMGEFTFYGYGPSAFLASNMQKGDAILIVRFKFRKSPYMLIGISKTVNNDLI